jgi:anti-anti-sigma regulatory factor/PAS domain-containing protein
MPQWWSGNRPIRWIALPYLLAISMLFIDLVAQAGWFVEGVSLHDGIYRSQLAVPGGTIMLTMLTIGWIVILVTLVAAIFIGKQQVRTVATILAATLLLTMIGGIVMLFFPVLGRVSNIALTLPVMGALTYAVLQTRLLTPTRAALDLALQAMNEAVIVLDQDTNVLYTNPPARSLGIQRNRPLKDVLASCRVSDEDRRALNASIATEATAVAHPLTIEGRRITLSHTPVRDRRGEVVGNLLLGRDVTEIEQRTDQLARERAQLEVTVRQLKREQQRRDELAATVRALSLPVIPVMDGVLVLPLIGDFDRARIEEFMSVLLTSIEREHAHLVLIDITGLPTLDAAGASGLLQSVHAASLLGTRCVLVGVRPEIAESLVALGISLDGLESAATLQQILPTAMQAEGFV